MKKTVQYLAPALLAMSLGAANAATIVTDSSFTGITDETDLDNSGTVFAAVNYDTSAGSTSINGITFTNVTDGAGAVGGGTRATTTDTAHWSADGSTVGAFDGLMDGHIASTVNQGGQTIGISVSGLTVGQTYQIQMLSGDASLKHTTSFYRSDTAAAKTQKLINQQAIGATTSDLGGIFSATFTTDDGNAFFTLERSAGDNQPVLSGYVITAIPEPSSAALFGLGGLALMLRRRK